MSPLPNRQFFQEKIMELGQALFYNDSKSVLRIPTTVVNILQVDDMDQVWFLAGRPVQNMNEFDRDFHARLELYRKGVSYHMHVEGTACLVTDPEELSNYEHLSEGLLEETAGKVLVCMKIKHIHYYPYTEKTKREINLPLQNVLQPLAFFKSLQYIVKNVIPVFQSH